MIPRPVLQAFDLENNQNIQPLTTGLINSSYHVVNKDGKDLLLQRINTSVFKNPINMQVNYQFIREHLLKKNSYKLPALIPAANNDLLVSESDSSWRCFEFLPGTYSPVIAAKTVQAYEVAFCFGKFTADLADFPVRELKTILPDFHNLDFRFRQFKQALEGASEKRKITASDFINEAFKKAYLLDWYRSIVQRPEAFPLRVLHHDCKIANILFERGSDLLVCPIDMDTTQPGLFFSDIGDMFRSMVPNVSEEEADINLLEIRTDYYEAILKGYLDAMGPFLTDEEKKDIRYAGPVLTYMQALRYLADYLNNDTYYRIDYPSQNLDRTRNQFKLLTLLEEYLDFSDQQ